MSVSRVKFHTGRFFPGFTQLSSDLRKPALCGVLPKSPPADVWLGRMACDRVPRLITLMRIANLVVDTEVLLAPMAAVTDLPFRTICEEHGVGLTITEFLSARALCEGAKKTTLRSQASLPSNR